MSTKQKSVCRQNMRSFDRKVVAAILHLIETHQFRARMIDGGHVFIYATNGDTLKVSRSRRPSDSMSYLKRLGTDSGCEC